VRNAQGNQTSTGVSFETEKLTQEETEMSTAAERSELSAEFAEAYCEMEVMIAENSKLSTVQKWINKQTQLTARERDELVACAWTQLSTGSYEPRRLVVFAPWSE
jgi:hypothetical protein